MRLIKLVKITYEKKKGEEVAMLLVSIILKIGPDRPVELG